MADDEDSVNWNVDLEVGLFHAMRRHKPVGVSRHFQMACIYEKLNSCVNKKIPSKDIWKHLTRMYDLQALNDSEVSPFSTKDVDFLLPSEYSSVMTQEFPRTIRESAIASSELERGKDTKEARESCTSTPTPATPASSSSSSKASKHPSATEKFSERLLDVSKTDDSPKREQRKRTRHATQSPVVMDNNPVGSAKRARRT